MEEQVVVKQCLTCQVGNDNPEWLEIINQWLGEGKSRKWIAERAKDSWGIELNTRSLKRHFECGHLPDRYRIAREALEKGLGEKYAHMRLDNVAALKLTVDLWQNSLITAIGKGEATNIPSNVAMQAIKELNKLSANKPSQGKIQFSDETYIDLMKLASECMKPGQQPAFRAKCEEFLKDSRIEQIKAHPEYRAFYNKESETDPEDQE